MLLVREEPPHFTGGSLHRRSTIWVTGDKSKQRRVLFLLKPFILTNNTDKLPGRQKPSGYLYTVFCSRFTRGSLHHCVVETRKVEVERAPLPQWKEKILPAAVFIQDGPEVINYKKPVAKLFKSELHYEAHFSEMKVKVKQWGNNEPSCLPARQSKMISGVYYVKRGAVNGQIEMEHCALNGRESQWKLMVKGRLKGKNKNRGEQNKSWSNVLDLNPNAKTEIKHRNSVILTIDSSNEDHEFAVFGIPEKNDKKRMQMGLFGEKPVQGLDWKIWAILFDDTMMAFKHVCEMQERKGRQLLTTLAGLFVSNSNEDIEIVLSSLESGWQIKGSKIKTVTSKDAWISPESSTDFPGCYFEIAHKDRAKRSFSCGITASHGGDNAKTKVVAFYEEEKKFSPRMKNNHDITGLSI